MKAYVLDVGKSNGSNSSNDLATETKPALKMFRNGKPLLRLQAGRCA